MAEEQQKKSSRIYTSGSAAKTTYQGSARGGSFNPVKAANTDKARAEERRRIAEDGDTKMRELRREQIATTTSLRAQQTAELGSLKLDGSREADALRVQQKYDQDTLKQEHTFEEHKMALESSHLQAKGNVAASRIKVADSVIQGVISLSGTFAEHHFDQKEKKERKEAQTQATKAAFSIEDNPDPTPAIDNAQVVNSGAVAAEDAIREVDSPAVQHAIRREVSTATIEAQQARSNVYQAQNDFGTFFYNWTNDADVVYTRPNGSTFTVATMEPGDTVQVEEAAKAAFYKAANIGAMPVAEVASVLVPSVLSTAGAWSLQTAKTITDAQDAAAIRSTKLDITDSLAAGVPMEKVFDDGFTGLYTTNAAYTKGKSNDETVETILDFAVATKNPRIIDELDRMEKIPGNPGTRIGRQYSKEIAEARKELSRNQIDSNTMQTELAAAQAGEIERNLSKGLSATTNPAQERELNLEAANALRNTGDPNNILRAYELEAEKEYNPYTAQRMLREQADGKNFTQEELQQAVNNKDILASEAKTLGWNDAGGESADTVRRARVETFKPLAKGQANAIIDTVLNNVNAGAGTTDKSSFVKAAKEGDGKGTIDSITDRLLGELDLKLKTESGSQMTDDQIREWMQNRRDEIVPEVEYKDGEGLIYNFGRDNYRNDSRGLPTSELATLNNAQTVNISKSKILTGEQIDTAVYAIENGQPFSQELEARAAAVGTNVETLLKEQLSIYKQSYPTLVTPPTPVAQPMASSSAANLTPYDTGEEIGGISLDNLRNAIVVQESGNDFTQVNPHSGALGFAQVMPENVGPWSREALGAPISQRRFLREPDTQMAVINHRFRKMLKEQSAMGYTGDILARRVASIWYSGQAGLYNNSRPQYYGAGSYPSIQEYTMSVVGRYRAGN